MKREGKGNGHEKEEGRKYTTVISASLKKEFALMCF
jgi:hypothetical protein